MVILIDMFMPGKGNPSKGEPDNWAQGITEPKSTMPEAIVMDMASRLSLG